MTTSIIQCLIYKTVSRHDKLEAIYMTKTEILVPH